MENVNQTDKELFRRALQEAFIRKFDRELEDCPFSTTCSEAHTRRMQEILAQSSRAERRRDRRKWVVALLVAAALLLTACTVYAYREEIRAYIEHIYDEHIKVTYDDETGAPEADLLALNYTLGYVPEGYELVTEWHLTTLSKHIWENTDGQWIILEQCTLDSTNFVLDVEEGDTTVIPYDKFDIYCRESGTYTYIWNDGVYSFKIKTAVPLPEETLIRIIECMQIES